MKKIAQQMFGRVPRGTDNGQTQGETLTGSVKASLDLGGETVNCDTVIEATSAGLGGNAITITFVHDAGAAATGTLTRVGNAFTYTYLGGTTTVADFEADVTALAGADDLIAVKTAGTGANVLADTDDEFGATALAGAADRLARVMAPMGHRWSAFFILTGTTPAGTAKAYYSNLPFPDPDTAAHWTAFDSDNDVTISAAGTFMMFGNDKLADQVLLEVVLTAGSDATLVGWVR